MIKLVWFAVCMFRLCVVASLVLIGAVLNIANAAPVTKIVWELPTLRVDGSKLPIAEIKATRLQCQLLNGDLTRPVDVNAPAVTALLSSLGLLEGVHNCFAVVIDTRNEISERSAFVAVMKTGALFSTIGPESVKTIRIE